MDETAKLRAKFRKQADGNQYFLQTDDSKPRQLQSLLIELRDDLHEWPQVRIIVSSGLPPQAPNTETSIRLRRGIMKVQLPWAPRLANRWAGASGHNRVSPFAKVHARRRPLFADGEKFPASWHGTGTEDYFRCGWYSYAAR